MPEGADHFGGRFQRVEYGTGAYNECVYHPLAHCQSVDEIAANYTWPNPD